MTTDTVTSLLDDGSPGTLRIVLVGAGAGDTVVFAPGLAGGTVLLAGPLPFTRDVTVDGHVGGANITLNGQGQVTDIRVISGSVTLRNLTISAGLGSGVDGTGATDTKGAGGGVELSGGALTLDSDLVIANTAIGGLGSDPSSGGGSGLGGYAGGGVVVTGGSLTVVRSSFNGNRGTGGNGGDAAGAILVKSGSVSISSTSFTGNYGYGGTGGNGSAGPDAVVSTGPGSGGYGGAPGGVPARSSILAAASGPMVQASPAMAARAASAARAAMAAAAGAPAVISRAETAAPAASLTRPGRPVGPATPAAAPVERAVGWAGSAIPAPSGPARLAAVAEVAEGVAGDLRTRSAASPASRRARAFARIAATLRWNACASTISSRLPMAVPPRSCGSAIVASTVAVMRIRTPCGRCGCAPARSPTGCPHATYCCRPTTRCGSQGMAGSSSRCAA